MFKRILVSIIALCLLVAVGSFMPLLTAQAVDVVDPVCQNPNVKNLPDGEKPAVCRDNNSTTQTNPITGPEGVLTTYVRILSFVIGILAVGAIIVAGIRFTTSNGDPQTVSGAQKTIIYAVVGLVVAAVAQALVIFVLNRV